MGLQKGTIITITRGHDNWGNGMNNFVGLSFKLINPDTNQATKFENYAGDMDRYGWQEKNGHYRQATPEEEINYYSRSMTTPVVGQSVILKEDSVWNSSMIRNYKNKVATVRSVDGYNFRIQGDPDNWNFRGWEPDDGTQKIETIKAGLIGSSRTIAGEEGTILMERDRYYWRPHDGDMEAISRKKGLNVEKFAEYVLGYSETYQGDLILCRTEADLDTFLASFACYQRGSKPSIELPSYGGYYTGDEIPFAGDTCQIEEDSSGTHPFYLSNVDCDEVFEKVEEVTGLDRYEHQKSVLGYSDPHEYDFPQAASIRDLLKYVETLKEILLRHERGERILVPDEDFSELDPDPLKDDQVYILDGYKGTIRESCGSWFWSYSAGDNDIAFKKKGINKEAFQRQVLRYSNGGGFPYCRSAKDLQIFLEAIANYPSTYPPQQRETPPETLYKEEGAVNTPQIIFINVPKI